MKTLRNRMREKRRQKKTEGTTPIKIEHISAFEKQKKRRKIKFNVPGGDDEGSYIRHCKYVSFRDFFSQYINII